LLFIGNDRKKNRLIAEANAKTMEQRNEENPFTSAVDESAQNKQN
jgi:hypothetical protein